MNMPGANLKVYKIEVDFDDETGCDAISLVDQPAVEVDFLKFDKDKEHINFNIDSDKHIITGVALRADFPIYRNNAILGEHYVVFEKDTIMKIVEKYSKMGLHNSVNLNHNDGQFTNDVCMFESYIVDRESGICPTKFNDISDGSWIVSFKVYNDEIWDQIKDNELNGFSIQGIFKYSDVELSKEEHIDEPIDEFSEFVDKCLNGGQVEI